MKQHSASVTVSAVRVSLCHLGQGVAPADAGSPCGRYPHLLHPDSQDHEQGSASALSWSKMTSASCELHAKMHESNTELANLNNFYSLNSLSKLRSSFFALQLTCIL